MVMSSNNTVRQMPFHRWLLVLALLASAWMVGSLLSAAGIYMFVNTQEYKGIKPQPNTQTSLYRTWEAKICLYFGMAINLLSMLVMVMMILYERRAIIQQRVKPDPPPTYKDVMEKPETPPPSYRELHIDDEAIFNNLENDDNRSYIDIRSGIDDRNAIDNMGYINNRSYIDIRRAIDDRSAIDNSGYINNRSYINIRSVIGDRSAIENRSYIDDWSGNDTRSATNDRSTIVDSSVIVDGRDIVDGSAIDNSNDTVDSSGIDNKSVIVDSSMQIANDSTSIYEQPIPKNNNVNSKSNLYQGLAPIHENPPPEYTET